MKVEIYRLTWCEDLNQNWHVATFFTAWEARQAFEECPASRGKKILTRNAEQVIISAGFKVHERELAP